MYVCIGLARMFGSSAAGTEVAGASLVGANTSANGGTGPGSINGIWASPGSVSS